MRERRGLTGPSRPGVPVGRAQLVAVCVCLVGLFVAGLAVLTRSAPRRAGTNLALVTSVSIPIAPGQELCQPGEFVPADTAGLRFLARSSGSTGRLTVRAVVSSGRGLTAGTLAPGWRQGTVTIPVGEVRRTTAATVCLRNDGPAPVVLGGTTPDPPYTIAVAGHTASARVRLEYMRPGRESWLGIVGVLSYRFSLGRSSLLRWWASAAVLVLMLAACALTVRAVLRSGQEL